MTEECYDLEKTIKEYPNYTISEGGVIRNIKNGKIIPQYHDNDDYSVVTLIDQ